MSKRKRTCKDCALFVQGNGISRCRLYAGDGPGDVVFPENRACKMITGPINGEKKEASAIEPEAGTAPFCGDFPKCNNAEGCDCCVEFEKWALGEIKKEQL